MDMLCFMHQSEDRGKLVLNGNAVSDETLGRILGLDKQKITSALKSIFHHGVASRDIETGAIINRRMVRDEEIRRIRSKYGSMGGNPLFAKGKTNPYYDGGAKKDKQNDNLPDNQTDKQSDNQKISSSSSASTSKENSLRSLQKDDGEDKQKRSTPIPKDFTPDAKSEDHRMLECALIVDKKFVIALCEFKAYWEDMTGTKALKKNWQRTWRGRLDVLQQREVERLERERSWNRAAASAADIATEQAAFELAEDQKEIAVLQATPKYKHLDVESFYTAMNKHCVESGETPTRDLLVMWLDYALTERGNGTGTDTAPLFNTALKNSDDDLSDLREDEL